MKPPSLGASADRVAGLLAWSALAASLLVIAGWLTGTAWLVRLRPGAVAMQFNAALGLMLAAGALLAVRRRGGRWAWLPAGGAALLALLTLAQYLLGRSLGVDELLLTHGIADRTVSPGRMAPATAFSMLLTAVAIAMLVVVERLPLLAFWVRACAATALLVALQALAAQWLGGTAGDLVPLTDIAVQTVVLVGALDLALILLARTGGASGDVRRVERLGAWCTLLIAGLAFVVWQELVRNEWRERAQDTVRAQQAITRGLALRMAQRGSALQRMAERWRVYEIPQQSQWEDEARLLLRDFPELIAVVHADSDYRIRWRVARDGGTQLIGASLGDAGRVEVYAAAVQARAVRLTPALELRSGGLGVSYVAPVHVGDALAGYIAASVRADEILQSEGDPWTDNFNVALHDGHRRIAGMVAVRGPAQALMRQSQFDALGQPWTVQVWPRAEYLARMHSRLPESVLLLGLLTAALVGAAFLQARRSLVNQLRAEGLSVRLGATLENISDAFYTLDDQWRFTYLNAQALRLLRRGRDELLGRVIWEAFPEAAGTAFQRNYERALFGRMPVAFEQFYAPLDTWFEIKADPSAEGLAVYFRDVTELRNGREALRRSEERLRLLSRASKDAIWDWDLERGALEWSESLETLFGHARAGIIPDRQSWTARVHPEDRARVEAGLAAAIAGSAQDWSDHYRFARGDGSFAHVQDRGFLIRDATGRAVRMVGGINDVTDRVLLEEQLRQSQRLESVGQLTGGVAHDFNNLLTVILGNAELLQERLAGDARLGPLAGMVVDAAERGADLTRRLLAFARKQALEPQAVDVNALVQGMDGLLRRSLGEHIQIAFRPATTLWRALVDPAQLDSALLNLCLNARDAMPGGGQLTLETSNVHLGQDYAQAQVELQPGPYVMLAVSDTGTGIAPEHLGRVFEPFFTTKEKGKGTGLGLAMIYGFAKQSGGHVAIYSEQGQGTTVKLYLPRAAEATRVEEAVVQEQAQGGSESILLVEDDAMVRRYAHDQLRALGYRVIEAAGGAQALDLLKGGDAIDLLFTDVVMPGMSGRVLADLALAQRPGLKVLFTSGYTENAIVHHGRLDPGVHLLGKPYRRQELARRVREALG
jgi:PAS domain S-box-containing protein